jgi:carboxylesterase
VAADWLLIHGAGGGAWEWRRWQAVLAAEGWCSEALELQPADAGLSATTLADYAAQVRSARQRCRPRVLVGASLGGLLAQIECEREPAVALVLVNALPLRALPPYRWKGPEESVVVPWRAHPDRRKTRRAMPGSRPADQALAHALWRDESAAVLREALRRPAGHWPRLASCTLVLAGSADAAPDLACQVALAAALAAELIRVPGAGHLDPLLGEIAVTVARLTVQWLILNGIRPGRTSSERIQSPNLS